MPQKKKKKNTTSEQYKKLLLIWLTGFMTKTMPILSVRVVEKDVCYLSVVYALMAEGKKWPGQALYTRISCLRIENVGQYYCCLWRNIFTL